MYSWSLSSFFLTSMQFQEVRALNVKLPKIDTAGSNKITNQLIVSVSKEGEYYLNGNKDDLEEVGKIKENSCQTSSKTIGTGSS